MSVKVFRVLNRKYFKNERKFQIFIQETFFDFIPRPVKKPIYKEYFKNILYEKYGPEAFLIPEHKLFPIVNINTGQFDDRLIQYALIRGIALRRIGHEFDYIYERAMECFKKHNCKDMITITVEDEKIPFLEFLQKYDELDGKVKFDIPDDAWEKPKPGPHKPKHFDNSWCFQNTNKYEDTQMIG